MGHIPCPTRTWNPSHPLQMLMPVPVPVGYMVLYRSLLPVTTSWIQHDAGRELSAIIPALRRGYKYEFKVRPYTGGTQGSDSNSRHLWIPEEGALCVPWDVWVEDEEVGWGSQGISTSLSQQCLAQRPSVSPSRLRQGTAPWS